MDLGFNIDPILPHIRHRGDVPSASIITPKTNHLWKVTKHGTKIAVKWWRIVEHSTQNLTKISFDWEIRMNLGFRIDSILPHIRHRANIPSTWKLKTNWCTRLTFYSTYLLTIIDIILLPVSVKWHYFV